LLDRLVVAAVALGLCGGALAEEPWPLPDNPPVAIPGGAALSPAAVAVELPGFRISRFEITNAEYERFVAETGHRPSHFAGHPEIARATYPVVGVSWDDAMAFCRHYGLSLPTETQWDWMARGKEHRNYAWGDEAPGIDHANLGSETCCGPNDTDGFAGTAPVGSFPKGDTPDGVSDVTGNVWEWVDGWYEDGLVDGAGQERKFRVLRGGAWNSDDAHLQASYRLGYRGDFRYAANGGFRCVAP
jgi:gamma-glutamyl hercynylcysteine S-oxide synthase